jgi:CheY-specific phosphatase CheX
MSTPFNDELQRSALLTFEQLGFMLPAEGEADHAARLESFARVRFNGEFSGELRLQAYGSITAELASSMLGISETPTLRQQADAFAEAANVACGNLLPGIAGVKAVFDLTTPEVGNRIPYQPKGPAARVELAFDQGHVIAELFLDEQETPA